MSEIKLEKFSNKPIIEPEGVKTYTPIIYSDSKGTFLRDNIFHPLQENIVWNCFKGSKSRDSVKWLEKNIKSLVLKYNKIWLYIWIGTCDITTLDRSTFLISLTSEDTSEIVEQITTNFQFIAQIISAYPQCRVTFLEIPIYSIRKWNYSHGHMNPIEFLQQDKILDIQVSSLNSSIKILNTSLNNFSPDFSYDLYRTSRYSTHTDKDKGLHKTRKYLNTNLYKDGIHPTPLLAKVWLKKFTLRIIRDCWI